MNLRQIATPLTAGAFFLMAVTGVLMFFHKSMGLNHEAHEWLSWAFLAGVGLHVYVNFNAFKRYFKPSVALGIIGLFVVITGLSFISLKGDKEGDKKGGNALTEKVMTAPITTVASLANMPITTVKSKLQEEGINITSDTQSIKDAAGGDQEKAMHGMKEIFGDIGGREGGKEGGPDKD